MSSKAKQKIDELGEKIRNLRVQRESMNPQNTISPPNKKNNSLVSTTSTSKVKNTTKKEKKHFHPNLDIVLAEMANSPYLIPPSEKYSPSSIRLGPELMKIRFEGKVKGAKIKKKDIPCDLKTAKKKWRKEVDGFHGHYNKAHAVKRPGQKDSSNKRDDQSQEVADTKKLNIV